MARISIRNAEDAKLWIEVLKAASPLVGAGVQGVMAFINLFRRTAGEPENQPKDLLVAQEVVASLTKAQGPFQQVVINADQELKD